MFPNVFKRCFCTSRTLIHNRKFISTEITLQSKFVSNYEPKDIQKHVQIQDLQKTWSICNLKYSAGHKLSLYTLENLLKHPHLHNHVNSQNGLLLLRIVEMLVAEEPKKRSELVWKIWNLLHENNHVQLDTYHTLLTVLKSCSPHVNAQSILDSMQLNGFNPTKKTYSLLLQCVCELNDFDDVMWVVEHIKRNNVEFDNDMIVAFLFAITSNRGLKAALDTVQSLSLSMTPKYYVSMLRGLANSSESEAFLKLLDEVTINGIELTDDDYLIIIESLIKGNLMSLIPNVLNRIKNWELHLVDLCNLCISCIYTEKYEFIEFTLKHIEKYLNHPLPKIIFLQKTYGEYLLEDMVHHEVPIEMVLNFCTKLENFHYTLQQSAYFALRFKQFDYALQLFEEMRKNGLPLRPHYFWPLFVAVTDFHDTSVLAKMQQFGVVPDYSTIRYYISPKCDNLGEFIKYLEKMKEENILTTHFLTILIIILLEKQNIHKVFHICEKFEDYVNYKQIGIKLAEALIISENVNKISKMLKLGGDELLLSVCGSLLNEYENEKNLKILPLMEQIYELYPHLREEDMDEIRRLQVPFDENLTSGYSSQYYNLGNMSVEELESYVSNANDVFSLRPVLHKLLIMYYRSNNFAGICKIKKEMESRKMVSTVGENCIFISAYTQLKDFEKAYELYSQMKNNDSCIFLDFSKCVSLATLAVENADIETAIEILSNQKASGEKVPTIWKGCGLLLKAVTDKYNVEERDRVYKVLTDKGFCSVSIRFLLLSAEKNWSKQDVEYLVEESIASSHRNWSMPLRATLLPLLIELAVKEQLHENSDNKFGNLLDKFLQTSSYIYGQSRTNLWFVICLARMGLKMTLRRYLMESFTGVDEKLMWRELNKLGKSKDEQTLLNLEAAFKHLEHCNMEPIYMNLLHIYQLNNDLKAAEMLLKSLEDSNRVPSVNFLKMLSKMQSESENG